MAIHGTVIRVSNVKPLVKKMAFSCNLCSETQVSISSSTPLLSSSFCFTLYLSSSKFPLLFCFLSLPYSLVHSLLLPSLPESSTCLPPSLPLSLPPCPLLPPPSPPQLGHSAAAVVLKTFCRTCHDDHVLFLLFSSNSKLVPVHNPCYFSVCRRIL